MSRLKIVFILSLVILGVLIALTVFRPMATGSAYSTVQQVQLLEREDQWIIELRIFNREGIDQNYTITVVVDGKLYSEKFLIHDGRIFTYIHHFYRDRLINNEVKFTVYKEGEATPLEEVTYYLQ